MGGGPAFRPALRPGWARLAAGAAFAVVLLGQSAPASAYQRPGGTDRVSVAGNGAQTDEYAAYPSISDDGRYVAFDSQAGTLVPGDTNGFNDIFVRDRLNETTQRVSVSSSGAQANDPVYLARISPGGRHVIFQSGARNLAPGDTGVAGDVFIRDLDAGLTERVSVNSDEEESNSLSFPGDVTPDGRYVVFEGWGSNLSPGDTNGKNDVFVRDRVLGTTERVSVAAGGGQRPGDSYGATISNDGRFVAYTALVGSQEDAAPGTIDEMQVFWHDRQTGAVRMVSVATDGTRGNGFSDDAEISGDGRYVAFSSQAQNLVPGDANRASDVFVHDTKTGRTRRASVTSTGAEGNGASDQVTLAGDGRYAAFLSTASNLAPGDTNGYRDAFVHDLLTGTTERVSLKADGSQATRHSENVFVGAGGRFVTFANYDALVPEDTNGTRDIFVRDRGPALGIGRVSAVRSGGQVDVSGWAAYSGATVSSAADAPGDAGAAGSSAGADLLGAEVVYRPESEDLFIRLAASTMPAARPPQATGLAIGCALTGVCGAGAAGAPLITYGLSFTVANVRYELRAERGAAPAAPVIQLLRCETACVPAASLAGSIGVSGDEAAATIPLAALSATPGQRLTNVRAWTAVGHPTTGAAMQLDEAAMPDADIPSATVNVQLSTAGVPVAQPTPAQLTNGLFSARLPSTASNEILVRACLDEDCEGATATIP